MSNWATDGKRWLPLSELLKQANNPEGVIYLVAYQPHFDGNPFGSLYGSVEAGQRAVEREFNQAVTWERDGNHDFLSSKGIVALTHGEYLAQVRAVTIKTGSLTGEEV